MTSAQLQKEILRYTRGLPKETLQEIIDFVQFVRQKKMKESVDNVKEELTLLDSSQASHVEEEFKDYKKLYPGE